MGSTLSTLRKFPAFLAEIPPKACDVAVSIILCIGSLLSEIPSAARALAKWSLSTAIHAYDTARRMHENSPSIYVKTPEEHIDDAWESRYGVVRRRPVPHWHIRIKFYARYEDFMAEQKEDMELDVRRERDGSLVLAHIRELWGLEAYAIIDPIRFGVFEPREKDRLSPVALKVLTEPEGHLTIFEPAPSPLTRTKRALRVYSLRECEKAFRRTERTHKYLADQLDRAQPWFDYAYAKYETGYEWARKKCEPLMVFLWDCKIVFFGGRGLNAPDKKLLTGAMLFFFLLAAVCWYFEI